MPIHLDALEESLRTSIYVIQWTCIAQINEEISIACFAALF